MMNHKGGHGMATGQHRRHDGKALDKAQSRPRHQNIVIGVILGTEHKRPLTSQLRKRFKHGVAHLQDGRKELDSVFVVVLKKNR